MADEPKFFSRNRIDRNSILIASTGQANAVRIFDRDKDHIYESVGSTNSIQETIEAQFKSGGLDFFQDVDFLAVLGHNLEDFKFQHDAGAGFIDTPGATVVGASTNFTLLPIANVKAGKIKLVMDTVQASSGTLEKQVGQVLVLKRLLELPTDEAPDRLGIDFQQVARTTRMLDEGTIINQLRWTGNRTERYRTRISFRLLSKANYDSLRELVKTAVFFIQAEPVQRPDEFFFVTHVRGGFPSEYTTLFKGNGYTISLNLEEV